MQVSVVISLYNKARHIRRALNCVLGQTQQPAELIVVDDGSTDGSGAIVRQYCDPRIRLVVQENCGAAAARNRGIQVAQCDLIAFLDADDLWDPDFLETVGRLRERFPEAAVWGTARRHLEADGRLVLQRYHGALPSDPLGDLIRYFAPGKGEDCPLHSSSVLVRRDALLTTGGFPNGVVFCEDHDAWLRLALQYPIAWTPEVKVTYSAVPGDRVSDCLYVGNYPFFRTVRAYLRKVGPGCTLPEGVYEYLARRHTELLLRNWLAGERAVVKEIVHDCHRIKGYRFRCFVWGILARIPPALVRTVWSCRRRLAGRGDAAPVFRSMYPEKYEHLRTVGP